MRGGTDSDVEQGLRRYMAGMVAGGTLVRDGNRYRVSARFVELLGDRGPLVERAVHRLAATMQSAIEARSLTRAARDEAAAQLEHEVIAAKREALAPLLEAERLERCGSCGDRPREDVQGV